MNPRVNLKLLVMVGQKFVMVGQETVMVGQMPAHAHPLLRHCFTAHTKISIIAVKFIPYFTDSSEKVVIVILLARIYVNNVAPISVDACLVHSDKLRT